MARYRRRRASMDLGGTVVFSRIKVDALSRSPVQLCAKLNGLLGSKNLESSGLAYYIVASSCAKPLSCKALGVPSGSPGHTTGLRVSMDGYSVGYRLAKDRSERQHLRIG